VLGKGLERLVARWMSWTAVHYKVLLKQQFGALPLRSAVDLTTCLTHDVETALNSNYTASLLTLDVKGAFDGVLPGRLIRRLREQGWPDCLVQWVSAFATNRSARIQLNGSITYQMRSPLRITCITNTVYAIHRPPLLYRQARKQV
jgi:hypothetical protein